MAATLYELDQAVKACIRYVDSEGEEKVVDTETGEILDLEALEAMNLARDVKLKNVALYILEKEAEAAKLKEIADGYAKRAKACKGKADYLKQYLTNVLQGETFKSLEVNIGYSKGAKVEIAEGAKLDERYLRFKDPEPNKDLLKKELKAGVEIEGVSLVETQTLKIKQ